MYLLEGRSSGVEIASHPSLFASIHKKIELTVFLLPPIISFQFIRFPPFWSQSFKMQRPLISVVYFIAIAQVAYTSPVPALDLNIGLSLSLDLPLPSAALSSIIQQQSYNLCLLDKALNASATTTCKPAGTSGLPPFEAIATLADGSIAGTFVAAPLTAYAALTVGTTISTTDANGGATPLPVGPLGQGKQEQFFLHSLPS
jgi:hypothetical protein